MPLLLCLSGVVCMWSGEREREGERVECRKTIQQRHKSSQESRELQALAPSYQAVCAHIEGLLSVRVNLCMTQVLPVCCCGSSPSIGSLQCQTPQKNKVTSD